MKMKAEQPQQAVSATGADTPSFVLEASLIEATPNANDAATYASLATIEDDDDIVRWYPLLIWHSNPKKARSIRNELTNRGLTTYLRLNYREAVVKGELQEIAEPVLSNLVFVKARKKVIRHLKSTCPALLSLQFMTKPKREKYEKATIISVRDKDMDTFISAETRPDPRRQRVQLQYKDYIDKTGRRVQIIRGPFVGIEGEVKHIGGHRVIVVKLRDIGLATGIAYIRPEDMRFLDD